VAPPPVADIPTSRLPPPFGSHERNRFSHAERFYGLEAGYLWSRLKELDGRCAICGAERWFALHLDHDHASNKFRDFLCETETPRRYLALS